MAASSTRTRKPNSKYSDCVTGTDLDEAIIGKKPPSVHKQINGEINNIVFETKHLNTWKEVLLSHFGKEKAHINENGDVIKILYNEEDTVNFNFYNTGKVNIQGATCNCFYEKNFENLKALVENELAKKVNVPTQEKELVNNEITAIKTVDCEETTNQSTVIKTVENNESTAIKTIDCEETTNAPNLDQDNIVQLDKIKTPNPKQQNHQSKTPPRSPESISVHNTLQNMQASMQYLEQCMCLLTKQVDTKIDTEMKKCSEEISNNKQEISSVNEKLSKKIEDLNQKVIKLQENSKFELSTSKHEQLLNDNIELRDANSKLKELITTERLENQKMREDNHKMREEINMLNTLLTQSESVRDQLKHELEYEKQMHNQTKNGDVAEQNTSFKISTENRFSILDNTPENSKQKKKSAHKVEIVMDSHGNGIEAKKLYKHQDVNITVLGKGLKNIKGAIQYIQNLENPQHIIIGVGSNDLSDQRNTTEEVLQRIESLTKSVDQSSSLHIHVLPVFERVNQPVFNKKAIELNRGLQNMCSRIENVSFVKNDTISAKNISLFEWDGIHFSNKGKKALARMIKTHMNPKLGLKEYENYKGADEYEYHYRSPNQGASPNWDDYYPRSHYDDYQGALPHWDQSNARGKRRYIEDIVNHLMNMN